MYWRQLPDRKYGKTPHWRADSAPPGAGAAKTVEVSRLASMYSAVQDPIILLISIP